MKAFTLRKEDVGKIPLDFYSFGHLLYGYSVNLIIFFILGFLGINGYFLGMGFVASLWASVIWEVIENFTIRKRRYGVDSLSNSLTDVLLTMAGATISHWWSFAELGLYLGLSITWILLMIVLYQLFGKITR